MKRWEKFNSMCVVQKRYNRARLRLLAFERSATSVSLGWHLRSGISGELSPFPDKNGSLSLNCLCRQYGLCCMYAFLLESRILCAKQRAPMWPAPDKNAEHSVSVELPWQKFHICCHSSLLEDLSMFWKKTLRSVCLVSSGLCPTCLFPLLILLWILAL